MISRKKTGDIIWAVLDLGVTGTSRRQSVVSRWTLTNCTERGACAPVEVAIGFGPAEVRK